MAIGLHFRPAQMTSSRIRIRSWRASGAVSRHADGTQDVASCAKLQVRDADIRDVAQLVTIWRDQGELPARGLWTTRDALLSGCGILLA